MVGGTPRDVVAARYGTIAIRLTPGAVAGAIASDFIVATLPEDGERAYAFCPRHVRSANGSRIKLLENAIKGRAVGLRSANPIRVNLYKQVDVLAELLITELGVERESYYRPFLVELVDAAKAFEKDESEETTQRLRKAVREWNQSRKEDQS